MAKNKVVIGAFARGLLGQAAMGVSFATAMLPELVQPLGSTLAGILLGIQAAGKVGSDQDSTVTTQEVVGIVNGAIDRLQAYSLLLATTTAPSRVPSADAEG